MPAPECTCGACQVTFCALHEAAGDLYTALERALELIDCLRYGPSQGYEPDPGRVTAQARAALAKANPQRTQEDENAG